MKENKSSVFVSSIVLAVCFIVFGLLLLIFPNIILDAIAYILAVGVAAIGIYGLFKFFLDKDNSNYSKYGLAYGVLFIILALFIVFKKADIIKILPYTVGAIILIASTLKIDYIIQLKKDSNANWKITLAVTIICFLLGIVLLFFPLEVLSTFVRIIGLIIIFYAVLDIINSYIIKTNLDQKNTETTVKQIDVVEPAKTSDTEVVEASYEEKETPVVKAEEKEAPVTVEVKPKKVAAKKATTKKSTAKKTTTKTTAKKPATKKTTKQETNK